MRFLGIAVLRAKRNVYHNLIKQKRQKLYASVKFRSATRQKTAKTLQACAVYAAYAPKNGRNFTALSRKSRLRALIRQKLYNAVKKRSFANEKAVKLRKTQSYRLFLFT